MLTELTIPSLVHLNNDELYVTLFKLWEFSITEMSEVSGFSERRIKAACGGVIAKLGCGNPNKVRPAAKKAGFDVNGTFDGQEIFIDELKSKILLINPDIQFLNPPGKKKAVRT